MLNIFKSYYILLQPLNVKNKKCYKAEIFPECFHIKISNQFLFHPPTELNNQTRKGTPYPYQNHPHIRSNLLHLPLCPPMYSTNPNRNHPPTIALQQSPSSPLPQPSAKSEEQTLPNTPEIFPEYKFIIFQCLPDSFPPHLPITAPPNLCPSLHPGPLPSHTSGSTFPDEYFRSYWSVAGCIEFLINSNYVTWKMYLNIKMASFSLRSDEAPLFSISGRSGREKRWSAKWGIPLIK